MCLSEKPTGEKLRKAAERIVADGQAPTVEAAEKMLTGAWEAIQHFENKRRVYEEHIARGCPREIALRAMVTAE